MSERDSSLSSARRALVSARALLENHSQWTKRASARDSCGLRVDATSDLAVAWDMAGAIDRASAELGVEPELATCFLAMVALRRQALGSRSSPSLNLLNDGSTWEQVLDAFDEAVNYADSVLARRAVAA